MKRIKKITSILLSALMLMSFAVGVSAASEAAASYHHHGALYTFDDETMMIYGVYDGNRVEYLISDIETFSGDGARVFSDDREIFEGRIEEGMTVRVYHSGELFGTYTVARLLERTQSSEPSNISDITSPDTPDAGILGVSPASNSYGFILPIDGINLETDVSYRFGSNYGGSESRDASHRGIDIFKVNGNVNVISGKPIRAVKDGTVEWAQEWDGQSKKGDQSWGHCVKIAHSDGVSTLYAHMNAKPLVEKNETVSQGQIIGYVGGSGNAEGHHLHLEVTSGGSLVDPEGYLAGAGSYNKQVPETFTGDVNGDGYDDIIEMRASNGARQLVTLLGRSDGSVISTAVITNTTNMYIDGDPVFIGDVNGDGRADVIVHFVTGGKRGFVVYTGKSNGGFNNNIRIVTTNMHDPSVYPCKLLVGDFSGDGKDDFLVQFRDTDGTRSNHLYKGNSGGGFNAAIKSTSSKTYVDSDPAFAADVNGDGCCDIVVHWVGSGKVQLLTFKGNTTGIFSAPVNLTTSTAYYPSREYKFFTGDFNGDGRDDLLVHWSTGNGGSRYFVTYRGNSACSFEAGVNTFTGSSNVTADPILIGDVNGDNIDDVIVEYKSGSNRAFNVYAGTSSGTFAEKVITVTTNIRDSSVYPARVTTADVTNDGLTDVVVIWCNTDKSENVLVYKGLSTKKFAAGVKTRTNIEYYFSR